MTTLRQTLFPELEEVVERKLGNFDQRQCADASSRLRPIVRWLTTERETLVEAGGVPDRADAARMLAGLMNAVKDVHAAFVDLDFLESANTILTDAQVTAIEMGRGLMVGPGAADPAPAVTGDDQTAVAAAVAAIGQDLFKTVRDSYSEMAETAVARHAAVASAATRAMHVVGSHAFRRATEPASVPAPAAPPSDPSEAVTEPTEAIEQTPETVAALTELEEAVERLCDWLEAGPFAEIRDAARGLIEDRAGADGKSKSEEPVVDLDATRARWNRNGSPERIRAEAARLHYLTELGAFGTFLDRFVTEHLLSEADEVAAAAMATLDSAVGALRQLHDEASDAYAAAVDASPSPKQLLTRGRETIDGVEKRLVELADSSRVLEGASGGLDALSARVGALPEALSIGPRIEPGGVGRRKDDSVTIEPREWAESAFGVPLLESLRDSALPFSEGLTAAIALMPGARTVLEYNLGAAGEVPEGTAEDARTLRRELVLGGLDRTADRLADAVTRFQENRVRAPLAAQLVLDEAAAAFWARARAEASLEGRARDIWTSIIYGADAAGTWAEREGARLRGAAAALFRMGSARALRTLRRARAAVGADPVAAERIDATVREIADVDAIAGDLPFVYRSLFSYRAVTDPSLLLGREDAVETLDRHLERWKSGTSDPLLIVGLSGVGVSSLINVVRERWADQVDWCSVALEERTSDEARWSRMLAETLKLGATATSLLEVRQLLETRSEPPLQPQVCLLENFELLYRRGVLDSGLIGRTLGLMSATDSCVLWIAPLPLSAWQVLQVLNPGTAALARVLALMPLDRAQVEAAILARHQRSGIPLHIEEPPEPPIGLRRTLAKMVDDRSRQDVLRTAFFDRLFELSDGYVALAILYWLRSARLDPQTEVMRLSWPDAIDFGAWDDLDSTGAFALRAFLEHGSLTLAEYGDVFGASEDEAFAVFERLGNLLLIDAVGPNRDVGTRLQYRRVNSAARYRVRPVLVQPVERLLRSRRLLY